MKKLKLVFPCEGYADEWDAIIKEMEIETIDITPYSLKHRTSDYNEYLRIVRSFASGIDIPAGKVKAATYFLVEDTKKRILGAIDIRFDLNEYLYNYGGNIGYGIRPSERRKGYATKMLALALDVCRQSGLKKVLVTCDEDNIGSRRTIEKNGGVLENIVVCEGENVMRFWINLV
ncbi:MAG: GNAT family N-acetyltransferase [Candidatus Izemoplasmatales bacterium]|jgi:predicted acetyltransferase|nr:GNAT family N-acetyltransferase [Candidatus Izemoplasmatales bacterium]MDD3865928.1 GNAT family N-acetyltransferase [Candidatus Izemoplasmatales bacterium]